MVPERVVPAVLGGIASVALVRPMAAFQLVYVALSVGAMVVLWGIPEHRDWLTQRAPWLQTVVTSLFIVSASAHGACSTTDPGLVVDKDTYDDAVRAYPWDGRFYAPGAKTFTDVQLAGGKRGDIDQLPRPRAALDVPVKGGAVGARELRDLVVREAEHVHHLVDDQHARIRTHLVNYV